MNEKTITSDPRIIYIEPIPLSELDFNEKIDDETKQQLKLHSGIVGHVLNRRQIVPATQDALQRFASFKIGIRGLTISRDRELSIPIGEGKTSKIKTIERLLNEGAEQEGDSINIADLSYVEGPLSLENFPYHLVTEHLVPIL